MSLLLDALKKAGQNGPQQEGGKQETSRTMPELTLEEHPGGGKAHATQTEPRPDAARLAGKKMFTAKTAPIRGRIQLGIVPITLIGGAVFAAAYGSYLWYQITPHRPAVRPHPVPVHQPAPPPSPPAPPLAPAPTAEPAPADTPITEPEASTAPERTPQASAPAAIAAKEPAPERFQPRQRIRIENHQQTSRIDPILSSAYQAYQQGDFAAAQQQYVNALKQDPNNRDALLGIAALARQQGHNAIAEQYYQHVLALNPRDPEAYAGMSALNNDDSPGEESRLKLLLAQQPQSGTLNFTLGNLYAGQQRWPEAQQAYFNAFNLQPDNADYAFNLAVSLDHMGQSKAAAEYYQRALQLGSTSATAGFDRAQVQQRLDALRTP
jgi:Tfp pilus assembly protein PilF